MADSTFREQIQEDIAGIQENISWDSNISKEEYAFNYWILANIYNLDVALCEDNITEYNDKGIDCFVHYEEDKELYIIQNKYYQDGTVLSNKDVSDLLTRPIASLNEGKYKKSADLQKIYNKAKEDKDYKIFLHLYVTNNDRKQDNDNLIKNHADKDEIAEIFYLDQIKDLYYGKSYQENLRLDIELSVNEKTYLAIRPEDGLPTMSEAYHIMARVDEIYSLWSKADQADYPLFEENIREYLGGTGGVNKAVITTLKDEKLRNKFFYYNNGITIICDEAIGDAEKVAITNPQVVNGCQTVNSIAEVLKNYNVEDLESAFSQTYIIVKVLVLDKKTDAPFYQDIVKYTNSQNSINKKVFGASKDSFLKIQKSLKEKGFLLCVKQSDKNTFKDEYKIKKNKGELLNKAKEQAGTFYEIEKISDVQIPLDSLLQVILAFTDSAYSAYTKKGKLLDKSSVLYQDFSLTISDIFTIDSIVKLILLYKKAEYDKRRSSDKQTQSPFYLLNIIGSYLAQNTIDKQMFLKKINIDQLNTMYERFKNVSKKYFMEFEKQQQVKLGYNTLIKTPVDTNILKTVIDDHITKLAEYNADDHKKLIQIIEFVKKSSEN